MNEIKIVKPYPLHEVPGELDTAGRRAPSTFHQLLMLPEQIGLKSPPDAVMLFCVQCKTLVAATSAQYQQAQAAAEAEGVGAIVKGPVTAGALSDVERAGLYHAHRLEAGNVPTGDATNEARKVLAKAAADLEARGLYDCQGSRLTDAGAVLAASIADPAVPDLPPVDPTWAARHLADLKKKAAKEARPVRVKAPAEPAPMLCVCGCGPREHLNTAGSDVPCKVCGVTKCKRFRQMRAVKPKKVVKVKAEVTP